MLTVKQKHILALASGNKVLAESLKRNIAEKYDLETWEKVDLARAFAYENWRNSEAGRLDDILFQLDEERRTKLDRQSVQTALHSFGYFTKRIIKNA